MAPSVRWLRCEALQIGGVVAASPTEVDNVTFPSFHPAVHHRERGRVRVAELHIEGRRCAASRAAGCGRSGPFFRSAAPIEPVSVESNRVCEFGSRPALEIGKSPLQTGGRISTHLARNVGSAISGLGKAPQNAGLSARYGKVCGTGECVAGAGGFEPPYGGIKIRCLTAWRRPNAPANRRARTIEGEPLPCNPAPALSEARAEDARAALDRTDWKPASGSRCGAKWSRPACAVRMGPFVRGRQKGQMRSCRPHTP